MGRAAATALAAAGAKVAALDVNADIKGIAREIGAHACVCDMEDARQVERSFAEASETCGPVRILVACAAIGRMEPIVGPGAVPYAQLAQTLRVNLIGVLQLVQLFASDLLQRERLEEGERGVAVMVASGAAYDGPVASAAYTASKGGIVSMTLALARELGDHGIRINTISPGAFDTAMVRGVPAEMLAAVPAMTPFPKRMGRPSEFADLALHICTNRFLNGSVIRLDGANRVPYFSTAAL
jgi:NAD(P)-dependent dehydrogenase (short-subunit alcohol dehydrogenase family)